MITNKFALILGYVVSILISIFCIACILICPICICIGIMLYDGHNDIFFWMGLIGIIQLAFWLIIILYKRIHDLVVNNGAKFGFTETLATTWMTCVGVMTGVVFPELIFNKFDFTYITIIISAVLLYMSISWQYFIFQSMFPNNIFSTKLNNIFNNNNTNPCPQCGKNINTDSQYCIYCGCKITVCHKCGALINANNIFCHNCGNRQTNNK